VQKALLCGREWWEFFCRQKQKKEKLRKIKKDFLKGGIHFLTIFYGRAVMSIGIVSTGSVALSLSPFLLWCLYKGPSLFTSLSSKISYHMRDF
jgi:hypothetical protein